MSNEPKILVVDDNADNRDLIRRRLEREGYGVVEAEDGSRALELIRQQPFDLVILDVMMPGLSGIDVLQTLRRRFSGAELPVIMATAKNQSEDIVEALDHGANDYVTKPLDFPVVLARVQAHLRTREASQDQVVDADEPTWNEVAPGKVLGGKYHLESELGSGNFGTVYRATHLGLEEPVAVKVLQTAVDQSSDALMRFQQEGISAFRVKHPNAVTVMDFHVNRKGLAYLVMELLAGHPLDVEIAQRGRFSVERAAEIVVPLCEVLAEAHGLGIIHRDIKPANIYLHRNRHGEVVKVLDFGIAKLVGESAVDEHLTLDEGILGTPAYMAPERLRNEPYDGRADVYSVGVLLYQMLAGRQPFTAERNEAIAVAMAHLTQDPEPLRKRVPDIPQSVEEVVMATLTKEPAERPHAAQLAASLRQAAGLSQTAPLGSAQAPDFAFADLLDTPLTAPPTQIAVPTEPPEDVLIQEWS